MNTIEKLQHDLSTWYEASPISQFMHWWTTELKSFVPKAYHQKLFPQAIKIYLSSNDKDDSVNVWSKDGDEIKHHNDVRNDEQEQESWWHQVQHIVNHADGKLVTVNYLLPNSLALVRKIALPQAAKENLDEVIGFELDKYVPFSLDQVQLDYNIDKINTNEEKLLMDLAVIPKEKINEILSQCDERSISLDGIDVDMGIPNQTPRMLGVNLLPKENRKAKDYTNLKTNSVLLVLLMALIYFVMHTSLSNKQNKIQRLTDQNSQLQVQARNAKLLRKELKEVIISSKFLQTKKESHPALITILSDVTSKLPDDTYLTHLKINQERVEIKGESDNANSLIPKLDGSKNWFKPEFIGAVVPNPRTNKEKFTIKAELNEPQAEEENGNKS